MGKRHLLGEGRQALLPAHGVTGRGAGGKPEVKESSPT